MERELVTGYLIIIYYAEYILQGAGRGAGSKGQGGARARAPRQTGIIHDVPCTYTVHLHTYDTYCL